MKRTLWFICLMAFMCAITCTAVWAEEKKPDAKKEAAPAPALTDQEKADYAKKVEVVNQIAAFGEAQKDPLAILGAIKMMDQLPFKEIPKAAASGQAGGKYDRATLVNEAKQFAAEDKDLLAVIAKVETPPETTAVRGHHGGHHGGHYYGRRHHDRYYDYYGPPPPPPWAW